MEWSTACPNWQSRIMARETLITFPPLFPQEADRGLEIFKGLHLKDVPGCPTYGQVGRQWQFDLVSAIFGCCDPETGRRLIREFFFMVAKKNDKALALDTPIPTPAGWKNMGDLQQGDFVFGTDGKPHRILNVSPIFFGNECYRVSFSNGESVIADAGHLWKTNALHDRPGSGPGNDRKSKPADRVRTTKEVAETLFRNDGARNHSICTPRPLLLSDIELPIPPYTLGAWLGDGHSRDARITCADEEIMQNITSEGIALGYRITGRNGKAWTQSIGVLDRKICYRGHSLSDRGAGNRCLACERETDFARRHGTKPSKPLRISLTERLRRCNLLNNKNIPEIYFRASISQRLSLLQGLMDTDGSISKSGRVLVYVSVNERLARDIGDLLSTLGIKYSLIARPMTCNGRKIDGQAWHLQFMAFRDELPVFRLTRKLNRMRIRGNCTSKPRCKTVQIIGIDKVQSVPVRCITVDSPDHQFLFGKTMLPTHNSGSAAGIGMTALVLNWRESAELIIVAPTIEIAGNSFKPARDMIASDPELSDLMQVQEHYRMITNRITGATLKIVAADSETVGGIKGSVIIVEELWLFGKRPNAVNMFREALGGLAARPEGFVLWLTTQSDEAPAGVFADKLEYARGVRDGKIHDPAFLPVIYEFPESILRETVKAKPPVPVPVKYFYIPNPNLGASVDEETIIREFKKAEIEGAAAMQSFTSKHLNIQIAVSAKSQNWAGADFWDAAAGKVTLDLILERCDVIVVGGDGGGLDDLLGLAVIGRDAETGVWYLWTHAWAHRIALERRKSEAPRYLDFAEDGDLTIVDDIGPDVMQFGAIVMRCEDAGILDRIGVDPVGIGEIVDELVDRKGIDHDRVVGISQGWRLSGAIKTTERKIAEKTLIHSGSRMMQWCVGNARQEPKGNAILITKQASGTGKIDPLMATFNAVALMAMNPEARRVKSVFDGLTKEQMIARITGKDVKPKEGTDERSA